MVPQIKALWRATKKCVGISQIMDFHQSADLSIILHFSAHKFFEIRLQDTVRTCIKGFFLFKTLLHKEFMQTRFTLTIIAFNQTAGVLNFSSDWNARVQKVCWNNSVNRLRFVLYYIRSWKTWSHWLLHNSWCSCLRVNIVQSVQKRDNGIYFSQKHHLPRISSTRLLALGILINT